MPVPCTVELSMTYHSPSSVERPDAVMQPLPIVCNGRRLNQRLRGPASRARVPVREFC